MSEKLQRYEFNEHRTALGYYCKSEDVAALEKRVAELEVDKRRIDFMERLLAKAEYTGKAILRASTTGRGWRLHETSWPGASDTVRGAIDKAMDALAAEMD